MKRIITSVGTSLLTNYTKGETKLFYSNEYIFIDDFLNSLEGMNAEDYKNINPKKIDFYKEIIKNKWIFNIYKDGNTFVKEEGSINLDASAEIKSLVKLTDKYKEELEVIFITTDTAISYFAAQIMKECLPVINGNINVSEFIYNIKGLQINNYKQFKSEGLQNLFEIVGELAVGNCALNISGGYKAVIPYMSLIGQIHNIPLVYIYENSGELIEISKLPMQFDWNFAENYYPYLSDPNLYKNSTRAINELKNFQLIKYDSDLCRYERTALGELFTTYIEENMPNAKNVIGYFVEYKLYEFLINNHYYNDNKIEYKEVIHSVRENWIGSRELDIMIRPSNKSSTFIAIEVKPSILLIKDKKISSLEMQIKEQIKVFKKAGRIPMEYHLYLYFTGNRSVYTRNIKSIKNIKNLIESENILFKVFTINIKYEIYDKENRYSFTNPYQLFMGSKLEAKDIEEVKINSI